MQAAGDLLGEGRRVDIVAARPAEQIAAGCRDLRSQTRHLAVGTAAGRQILLRLHEGRRIGDHHLEGLAGGAQTLHLLEGVGLARLEPVGDAVGLSGAGGVLQGQGGAVYRDHLGGAGHRALDAEAAVVAVEVDGAPALGERGDEGAVVALIIEPAGLLAVQRVGEEGHAILFQPDRTVDLALRQPGLLRQPFQRPLSAVVTQDDRARRHHLVDGGQDVVDPVVHEHGVGLDRHHVVEAVDDQAGQPVGLGMDDAVEGTGEQPLAQFDRTAQPVGDEGVIHHGRRIVRQQPRGDQRVRIEGVDAQRRPAGVQKPHRTAGRDRLGDGVHLDFVGIDPGMPLHDAPLAAGLQMDRRVLLDGFGAGVAHGAAS